MPHSSTVSFLSYWRGLQDSPDKAPSRYSFDPAKLKNLIPQMMMVSLDDDGYRFRLSGGFLVAFHGHELKQTAFIDLFQPAFINAVTTALTLSARRQQPLILSIAAPWHAHSPGHEGDDQLVSQSETVNFEICLCPMVNRDGRIDRFVGILQTLSPAPKNLHGTVGAYSLTSTRIFEHHRMARAAHLRLVSLEGRLIA